MRTSLAFLLLAALAFLSACGGSDGEASSSDSRVPVRVEPVQRRDLTHTVVLSGRLRATAVVEVQPKVTGRIVAFHKREGDTVRAGELLVELDTTELALELQRASALLAQARARRDEAHRKLARAEELHQKNVLSEAALETARAEAAIVDADRKTALAGRDLALLFAEGELQWLGLGTEVVTLCFRGDQELFQEDTPQSSLLPDSHARYEFTALMDKTGLSAGELTLALWQEAWQGSITAGCSTADVTMCRPCPRDAAAIPLMTVLFDSDPPLVKRTSSGRHPRRFATCPRATSIALRVVAPYAWLLDGFPKCRCRNGSIASTTAGSIGVVAL